MRGRRWLWAIGVVIAYGALLLVAVYVGNAHEPLGITLALGATVAFGAAVDRWLIALAPSIVLGVPFAIDYLSDPSCSRCGEDDSWGGVFFLTVVFAVLPLTAALLVGVAARRVARRVRRSSATRLTSS